MLIKSAQGNIQKKVLYAQAVYGDEEKQAVMDSLDNAWLASGPKVKEFEGRIAELFGKRYGVAVNSGSSGNLLALKALEIEPGGEVITPACTFATTVAEIVNNNLVPVFVDSVIGRYTIDESLVERVITTKTRVILVPQLVGGVCDMQSLRDIARRYNLYLIDDSCDTIAPTLRGRTVAHYADITTTSFYGSHIITACGMGGMILTDDEKVRDRLIVLRDWGRVGNDSEDFDARFNFEIDHIPYDAKFLYTELGYNLKMNEAAAAFGLVQLKRLAEFLRIRKENFDKLTAFFSKYREYFYLPYLIDGAHTNWLAYPLSVRQGAPFTRYKLLKHLESRGIQTRVLFSGNITRHPVYSNRKFAWVQGTELPASDYIMAHSFLIGCHNAMGDTEIACIKEAVTEFFA